MLTSTSTGRQCHCFRNVSHSQLDDFALFKIGVAVAAGADGVGDEAAWPATSAALRMAWRKRMRGWCISMCDSQK